MKYTFISHTVLGEARLRNDPTALLLTALRKMRVYIRPVEEHLKRIQDVAIPASVTLIAIRPKYIGFYEECSYAEVIHRLYGYFLAPLPQKALFTYIGHGRILDLISAEGEVTILSPLTGPYLFTIVRPTSDIKKDYDLRITKFNTATTNIIPGSWLIVQKDR